MVHVALAHLADGIGSDLVHLLHRALSLLLRLLLHLLELHLHFLSWSAPGKSEQVKSSFSNLTF